MSEEISREAENTNENSLGEDKTTDSSHTSETEIGKPEVVKEADRENARNMWAVASTRRGGEIESWDMFKKSNLDYREVQRLLRKYFEVAGKKGNKNIYKWDPAYEVPGIDDPGGNPFEENPKDPNTESQTYQHTLPNF